MPTVASPPSSCHLLLTILLLMLAFSHSHAELLLLRAQQPPPPPPPSFSVHKIHSILKELSSQMVADTAADRGLSAEQVPFALDPYRSHACFQPISFRTGLAPGCHLSCCIAPRIARCETRDALFHGTAHWGEVGMIVWIVLDHTPAIAVCCRRPAMVQIGIRL